MILLTFQRLELTAEVLDVALQLAVFFRQSLEGRGVGRKRQTGLFRLVNLANERRSFAVFRPYRRRAQRFRRGALEGKNEEKGKKEERIKFGC